MSDHKRIECKVCNKVIMSCRCMKSHDNIEYVTCDECANELIPDDVCCCGDAMEGHASPLDCGHSPVSMKSYYGSKNGDGT